MTSTSTSTSTSMIFRTKGPTGIRYPKEVKSEALQRALIGEHPKAIAVALNLSVSTVHRWISIARGKGALIKDFRSVDKEERSYVKMVRFNTELALALEDERKQRGYASVARFLHDVLGVMVEEPNLFDAVLDKD